MKKEEWKSKIRKACEDANTYQSYFDDIIDTLASIMDMRDVSQEKYTNTGEEPVISHTNKGGNANPVKNPYLVLISELNRDALAYWRDLGLTPAGYKKLNDSLNNNTSRSLKDI